MSPVRGRPRNRRFNGCKSNAKNKAVGKVRDVAATGADTLLAGDMGCLLNIAGKLSREGLPVRCYHVAEVLAGVAAPPIGETLPKSEAKGGKAA